MVDMTDMLKRHPLLAYVVVAYGWTWLTILPSIFLAGFFFPIEAMPAALRFLSLFVPLRYLLVILRGIILKGVGMAVLWDEVLALVIFGLAVTLLAAIRFRRTLD